MRRIEKRTSSALFLLLMGFAISSVAEPKMLVCETPVETRAKEYREMIASSKRKGGDAKTVIEWSAVCVDAEYGSRYNFVFDTKYLSASEAANVEVQANIDCGGIVADVVTGTMEATPTIITFKFNQQMVYSSDNPRVFNVDRKNLTGGLGGKRDHTCVLSDIDTSENLL